MLLSHIIFSIFTNKSESIPWLSGDADSHPYKVTQQDGTEPSFNNEYHDNNRYLFPESYVYG